MRKNKIFFWSILMLSVLFFSGCAIEDGREKIRSFWDDGKKKIEETLEEPDENLNPAFAEANEIQIELEAGIEINEYLVRNFKKVFEETKIVEAGQLRSTPFTFQYLMKKKFTESDLGELKTKFLETGSFLKEDAPISQNNASKTGQFGLFHNFGGRQYVLEFLFDYDKQLVWVNIY